MKLFLQTENGYRFNRIIMITPIIILLGIFIYIISINGLVTHPYVTCNYQSCLNPLLEEKPECNGLYCPPIECNEEWCSQEVLSMGEYGTKPSFLQNNFLLIAIGMLIFAFFINHVIYNKGVKFSVSTKRKILPDWMARFFPKFKNEVDLSKIKFEEDENE